MRHTPNLGVVPQLVKRDVSLETTFRKPSSGLWTGPRSDLKTSRLRSGRGRFYTLLCRKSTPLTLPRTRSDIQWKWCEPFHPIQLAVYSANRRCGPPCHLWRLSGLRRTLQETNA